jgi:hypothetical protein
MAMHMAYDSYKDTGIEWCPNVPDCWVILPARRVFVQVRVSWLRNQVDTPDLIL